MEAIVKQILQACYVFSIQVVLMLIVFNVYGALKPPKCPARSPSLDPRDQVHHGPKSIWYYEHVHDHQPAQLRILTDEDGAAPLFSNIPPLEREITIISGTTRERLLAVESTAMTWGGAFCLAVHVLHEADIAPLYEQLKEMHARVEERGHCRLDIVVVKEEGPKDIVRNLYPVNGMRNVAWRMATTELILLLDADFRPSAGMHESLTQDDKTYKELVRKATRERVLFVVPALEFMPSNRPSLGDTSSNSWDPMYMTFPETKEELRKGWANGTIDCFHCSFSPRGHESTNFGKFFDPAITSPYSIPYLEGYEPYMVAARDSTPMYDERFRGYGKNKISQIYACVHGHDMHFQVLQNAFIFEIPHPPSHSRKSYYLAGQDTSVHNLNRIHGLYRRFKKEVKNQREKRRVGTALV